MAIPKGKYCINLNQVGWKRCKDYWWAYCYRYGEKIKFTKFKTLFWRVGFKCEQCLKSNKEKT